jgi:hypothetical protein
MEAQAYNFIGGFETAALETFITSKLSLTQGLQQTEVVGNLGNNERLKTEQNLVIYIID